MGILHNQLKNYERIITPTKNHDLESIFHANMANFNRNGKYNSFNPSSYRDNSNNKHSSKKQYQNFHQLMMVTRM